MSKTYEMFVVKNHKGEHLNAFGKSIIEAKRQYVWPNRNEHKAIADSQTEYYFKIKEKQGFTIVKVQVTEIE